MDSETKRVVTKVTLDLLCMAAVGLPSLYLHYFGVPYHRGFFCDDLSIRYPYKDSTVSSLVLYFVGLGLPSVVMLCSETFLAHKRRNSWSPMFIFGKRIPLWMINSYKTIGVFCFGALCSVLVTDVAKYTIGRLRPHFYELCSPNVDCNSISNGRLYLINYECNGPNKSRIKDARLSFPSGHSSFAAYTMIYLALYIQVRFHWHGSYLLKRFFQVTCVIMAWLTALSRVSDYKHHWSDVLVGLFIGTTTSFLTVLFISKLFERRKSQTLIQPSGAVSSASNQAMVDKQEPLPQDGVHPSPVELNPLLSRENTGGNSMKQRSYT